MDRVSTFEWITLAAIIIGPILAVQAQAYLQAYKEKRAGRMRVFHALMATRAARTSYEHVQALNMIDIEFYGRRLFGTQLQTSGEKAVSNAWKKYSDHLNNQYPDDQFNRWIEDGEKLLAKLLFEMSKALGYGFDEVSLRRNIYSPIAHGKREMQEAAIRDGLEQFLSSQRILPVVVYPANAPAADAEEEGGPEQVEEGNRQNGADRAENEPEAGD